MPPTPGIRNRSSFNKFGMGGTIPGRRRDLEPPLPETRNFPIPRERKNFTIPSTLPVILLLSNRRTSGRKTQEV